MNRMLEEPLVLPADVLILSADEIDPSLLDRMEWNEGDRVVTFRNARGSSHKIDADTAGFLEHFREPRTILQAVFRHSILRNREAPEVLAAVFPVLSKLIQARLLVLADSEDASPLAAAYEAGARIGPFEVERCVQFLDDTEVYRVRDDNGGRCALKIAGQRPRLSSFGTLEREEAVLQRLGGAHTPRLMDAGVWDGKKYLATEWCDGVNAAARADALRKNRDGDSRPALIALCCEIARAYAGIHAEGAIHSDVHPRNVLIATDGSVKLVDFGLANFYGAEFSLPPAPRAGVGFYFEPEYARAKRLGEAEPAATEAGDQYQVAALIYFLLTRAHYLNFHLDRVAAYRQIEIEPPRPFLECASPAWPTVEAVLARALSKQPEARYPSMGEFERALREAVSTAGARTAAPSFAAADPADGRQFVDFIVQRYGEPGAGILDRSPSPPSCSVNYGAAGIAYLFYRLACIRGSAELLARADLWAEWALAQSGKDGAFHSCDLHLTAEMVGPVSLYHTASGIHCVRGLIAQAMGNRDGLLRDAGTFAAASSAACESLDLTLGRSSSLIGCALLYETLPPEDQMARPVLSRLGDEVLAEICSKVASTLPLDECTSVRLLGMAHGWAGILYGILRWRWASGGDVPGWVRMRIEELGALGQPVGKGIAWRLRPGGAARAPSWAGWCRGSAGYVHLWSMAHRVFQDHRFLELAERAAWHIWESSGRTGPNLCCGLTGEAYALLHLFRKTGQKEWFTRASDLGRRALEAVNRGVLIPGSLYKGDIGVALLMADLAEPMGAAMPMFETEEWASVAGV